MSSSKVEELTVPATKVNDSSRRFPALVVKVIDPKRIAINRVAAEGIQLGQRFIVYAMDTEELRDPETGGSLGRLELVKGTAVVSHIQDHVATLVSDRKQRTGGERRIVRRSPGLANWVSMMNSQLYGATEEIIIPPITEVIELDEPAIGDLVKPI